jgi:hypothetical protein
MQINQTANATFKLYLLKNTITNLLEPFIKKRKRTNNRRTNFVSTAHFIK